MLISYSERSAKSHCRCTGWSEMSSTTNRLPTADRRFRGLQGYLTKEQEMELREMRAAFPQSAAFHTDHDLLRFLRAREFNRKATWAMYQHYLSMVSLSSHCLGSHTP